MTEVLLEFEGYRYAKGYRLVPREQLPEHYDGFNDFIVPNGGERIPSEFVGWVCLNRFVNVRTPEELLRFIHQFGLLFGSGHVSDTEPWGDGVQHGLRIARHFRELLKNRPKGPKKLASIFNSHMRARNIDALKRSYERFGGTAPPEIEMERMIEQERRVDYEMVASVDLVADARKGVRFRISSNELIGALWWQLGLKLAGDTTIAECRHCHQWFEAGVGTGRRADAEFCSNDHKVKYFNAERKRRNRK
jgi:hypothetical protein